jgi:uncharacterized membrane protein (UPF0127 family)
MRFAVLLLAIAMLPACREKPSVEDDLNTIDLTLSSGKVIRVETMIHTLDLARGMQFRTSMRPDHGMLFFHPQTGKYMYWMYQTLIPLDMIWIGEGYQIVEIVPNAQPCQTAASQCPKYGGHEIAKYVLELGGGMAQKYGLQLGQRVQF